MFVVPDLIRHLESQSKVCSQFTWIPGQAREDEVGQCIKIICHTAPTHPLFVVPDLIRHLENPSKVCSQSTWIPGQAREDG